MISEEFPEAPGTTAEPSNQGRKPTCSSHAVAKAIVECLDEGGLDCSQEAVITALINLKQGNCLAQWPTIFNGLKIILAVWDAGLCFASSPYVDRLY